MVISEFLDSFRITTTSKYEKIDSKMRSFTGELKYMKKNPKCLKTVTGKSKSKFKIQVIGLATNEIQKK